MSLFSRITTAFIVYAVIYAIAMRVLPNGGLRASVATGLFFVFAGYLAFLVRSVRPRR